MHKLQPQHLGSEDTYHGHLEAKLDKKRYGSSHDGYEGQDHDELRQTQHHRRHYRLAVKLLLPRQSYVLIARCRSPIATDVQGWVFTA